MLNWLRRKPEQSLAGASGPIEVREAWARSSVDHSAAGGFFTIVNKGDAPDRLMAATSPVAARIEIHAIKVVGADIAMCPLADGIAIQAASTMTFKPRGYHLLIAGLAAPVVVGGRLPVTLAFENAGNVAVELTVEAPGPVGDEVLH